ncbi:MAG: hypothetical protein IK042_05945 [Bacteroidales bacterium]|nr:hypothetical protein [Bacteroidales bacterium]
MKTKNKKQYETPLVQIVMMETDSHILQTSGGGEGSGIPGYGDFINLPTFGG